MQVEFKQDKQLKEDQLIIKAKKLTPEIEAALAFLEEKLAQKITVYQGSDVIILPLTSILFFENAVKRSIMGYELGFTASYKKVFVSRRYYQTLISHLHEMR